MVSRAIIYGGKGALGSQCVSHFKTNNFWIANVDTKPNPEADVNIIVDQKSDLHVQEQLVMKAVEGALSGHTVDSIVCVAGGWIGGNANKNLVHNLDVMWKQSVGSAAISVPLAAKYLKNDGILVLTGSQAALKATPEMIGYGVAKAAVHQMVKSLGTQNSGITPHVIGILPLVLDTPSNRKWMPNADYST